MSVKAITWAFEHSRSKGAARLVLLAMADEASNSGELSAYRRSQSWIAAKANLSTRSVRGAIDELVSLGELAVLREGSGRVSADYQILMREEQISAPRAEQISGGPEQISSPSSRSFPVTPVVGDPSARTTRRSRFPERWEPGEKERESATAAGMDATQRREAWEQFRDHHTAKGSVMADWPAAWRTWCRNWKKFSPPAAASPQQAAAANKHVGKIMFDAQDRRVMLNADGTTTYLDGDGPA